MKRPVLTRDATLVSIIFVVAAALRLADWRFELLVRRSRDRPFGGNRRPTGFAATARSASTPPALRSIRSYCKFGSRSSAEARPGAAFQRRLRSPDDRLHRSDRSKILWQERSPLGLLARGDLAQSRFACTRGEDVRIFNSRVLHLVDGSCRSAMRIVSSAFSRSPRVKRRRLRASLGSNHDLRSSDRGGVPLSKFCEDESVARRRTRRLHTCRSLADSLFRSLAGIRRRPLADSVLDRHADRLRRRQRAYSCSSSPRSLGERGEVENVEMI